MESLRTSQQRAADLRLFYADAERCAPLFTAILRRDPSNANARAGLARCEALERIPDF